MSIYRAFLIALSLFLEGWFGGGGWGGGGGRRASILGSQQGRKMIENDVNVCKLISSLLSDFCCI